MGETPPPGQTKGDLGDLDGCGKMDAVVALQAQVNVNDWGLKRPKHYRTFSFIAGLLHHGYRLAPQARLGGYKEIEGRQVSWALGAAFNMLDLA